MMSIRRLSPLFLGCLVLASVAPARARVQLVKGLPGPAARLKVERAVGFGVTLSRSTAPGIATPLRTGRTVALRRLVGPGGKASPWYSRLYYVGNNTFLGSRQVPGKAFKATRAGLVSTTPMVQDLIDGDTLKPIGWNVAFYGSSRGKGIANFYLGGGTSPGSSLTTAYVRQATGYKTMMVSRPMGGKPPQPLEQLGLELK